MSKTLTLELPDQLAQKLNNLASQQHSSLEDWVLNYLLNLLHPIPKIQSSSLQPTLFNLDDEAIPIFQADDPLLNMAGQANSGLGDLSVNHNQYLYQKHWFKTSPSKEELVD